MVELLLGAITVLAGVIAFLFYRLENSRKEAIELQQRLAEEKQKLADERLARLHVMEAQLTEQQILPPPMRRMNTPHHTPLPDVQRRSKELGSGIQPKRSKTKA